MTVLVTASGRHIDLANIGSENNIITLHDVAHGLAKQCRFNGQIDRFYSVAEHSILVSRLVPKKLAIYGLLHDAAEAFLGDIVTPLKAMITGYDEIERKLLQHIVHQLGVDWRPFISQFDQQFIKQADLQALKLEKETFYINEPEWPYLHGVPTPDHKLECLNWMDARLAFIGRFYELTQSMGDSAI